MALGEWHLFDPQCLSGQGIGAQTEPMEAASYLSGKRKVVGGHAVAVDYDPALPLPTDSAIDSADTILGE